MVYDSLESQKYLPSGIMVQYLATIGVVASLPTQTHMHGNTYASQVDNTSL